MTQEWTLLAGQFQDSAIAFLEEFAASLRNSHPFPIVRFFQLFPLNPANDRTAVRLVARGNLDIANGSIINTGTFVDATFRDDNMGNIGVFFPHELRAEYQLGADGADVRMQLGEILVTLYDLPPELGSANRFVLKGVSLQRQRFTYMFDEDGTPANHLIIVSDFTRSPQNLQDEEGGGESRISAELKMRALGLVLASAGDETVCPGAAPSDAKWYVCKDDQGICRVAKGGCSIWGRQVGGPYDTVAQAEAAKAGLGCA